MVQPSKSTKNSNLACNDTLLYFLVIYQRFSQIKKTATTNAPIAHVTHFALTSYRTHFATKFQLQHFVHSEKPCGEKLHYNRQYNYLILMCQLCAENIADDDDIDDNEGLTHTWLVSGSLFLLSLATSVILLFDFLLVVFLAFFCKICSLHLW